MGWPLGDQDANSQVNCSDVDIVDNSRAVSVIFTGELLNLSVVREVLFVNK